MKISVQSVNFNIDNDLVKYIEKKVNNLEKFHDQILSAEVF
ncbi:MAG: HPF/RaiA family ribosome-associated protein, partial [Flavobacteriaceae bacterium]|nr:HPF/RaiA family ribosome-associated protein [Flavobacteriaceae bacterium]